jgi:hypothetical protein
MAVTNTLDEAFWTLRMDYLNSQFKVNHDLQIGYNQKELLV